MSIKVISVQELKTKLDNKEDIEFIDVREADEYEFVNNNAKLIPLSEFETRFSEIAKDKEVVITCKMGGRSMRACQMLEANGYSNLTNVDGGITKWALEIDTSLPTY
ncbi:MAG: rhodanese-related sulfurtransferase [Thermoproteota archaeon]|jgi:rhodanese-related sulfurtransferase